MGSSEEPTLGQIRNRIDSLLQRGAFDPSLPAELVWTEEAFHRLTQPPPTTRSTS